MGGLARGQVFVQTVLSHSEGERTRIPTERLSPKGGRAGDENSIELTDRASIQEKVREGVLAPYADSRTCTHAQ